MLQFSRSLYRHLEPHVAKRAAQEAVLAACEVAFDRLASDRRYFRDPARSLFRDIRDHFPIARQHLVRRAIEAHMNLAGAYVDRAIGAGRTVAGTSLACQARTRRGSACEREVIAGTCYCPSHKHLGRAAEAVA